MTITMIVNFFLSYVASDLILARCKAENQIPSFGILNKNLKPKAVSASSEESGFLAAVVLVACFLSKTLRVSKRLVRDDIPS